MNPGTASRPIDGIPTTEPAFNLPALWIPESAKAEAEMAGYTVIDPTSVIATHLTEIIKSHAPELLGPPRDLGAARQRQERIIRSSWKSWFRICSRSARCSACCRICCASAFRSAICC